MAFAEAELSGITSFGKPAAAAAGRLRWIAETGPAGWTAPLYIQFPDEADSPVTSLYTGLAGIAAALAAWADVTGDEAAAKSASTADRRDRRCGAGRSPHSGVRDIIEGDAGTLAVLAQFGGEQVRPAASLLADRLVGCGQMGSRRARLDGPGRPTEVLAPNFSHGSSGVAFALARASALLGAAGPAGDRGGGRAAPDRPWPAAGRDARRAGQDPGYARLAGGQLRLVPRIDGHGAAVSAARRAPAAAHAGPMP